MATTLGNVAGLNTETNKVINYMSGKRTAKQIVGEFFGLREEAIYDDNGENVVDFINEFKDLEVLKKKKVRYVSKLLDLKVTEEMFNGLFPNGLPIEEKKEEKPFEQILTPNIEENGKTNGGGQNNTGNFRKAKKR